MISDCNVNGGWDEGDASARLSRVKSSEPTMLALEVTGKIRVKGADDNDAYIVLRLSHFQDGAIDVLVLNGPISEEGSDGYRFEAKIFTWSEDQSLGAVLYKDFSIKPCIPSELTRYPKYARVAVAGTVSLNDIGV